MSRQRAHHRRRAIDHIRPFVFLLLLVALLAPIAIAGDGASAATADQRNTSIFSPKSPPAEMIRELSWLVLGITAVIGIVVEGLIIFAIIRYRRRDVPEGTEPPQVYGSGPIELAWTVVPTLIVLVLFLVTMRTIGQIELREPPENAFEVNVIGHQWWWEFEYPSLGITTANELHVPMGENGEPRPVFMRMSSADVIHSFWVPQLAGKLDLIPNHVNELWFEPSAPGVFHGQCAEYCGNQHANMLLRVVVQSHEDFQAWSTGQALAGDVVPSAARGRDLFQGLACINCHTVRGTVADGTFGPDLTHLMSRATIGSGVADNTAENLRSWVHDPQVLKPGCNMPDMKLTPDEVDHVVAYLLTLN